MITDRCLPTSSALLPATKRNCQVVFVVAMAVFFSFADRGDALRLTNMSAPEVADVREELLLDCKFDMGYDQLYAVKWYKDDQEFFRYMPSQKPTTMTFPVSGVHIVPTSIDCAQDHCRVCLRSLTKDHSGGAYRCEISTEAPTFRLASQTRNVTVAALPREKLRIEGFAQSYAEGDVVIAACLSDAADPAPILSWYMNGHQAPHKYVGEMTSLSPNEFGFAARSLTLRFIAERKLFFEDKLELMCQSSLPGILVPPQTARRTASLRSAPSHVINNQKLHWLNSCATSCKRSRALLIVMVTTVKWLTLFLNIR